MKTPPQILRFETLLKARFPAASMALDAPADSDGTWWLDVQLGGKGGMTLSWSERTGFGLYGADAGYGERPCELQTDPKEAILRGEQLMAERQAGKGLANARVAPATPGR